jgi:hypothetical protein
MTADQLLDRAAKTLAKKGSLTSAELVTLRDQINVAAAKERKAKRGAMASKLRTVNRAVRRAERAARKGGRS